MTAWTFVLRQADRTVGLGLICPEARYASVSFLGADRLERCQVSAKRWAEILGDLGRGLDTKPLPSPCAIAMVLDSQRVGLRAQWLHRLRVEPAAPFSVATGLDGLLCAQAQALTTPRLF